MIIWFKLAQFYQTSIEHFPQVFATHSGDILYAEISTASPR
jgi:hypothetical protein